MTYPNLRLADPPLPPLEYHIQDFLNAKASREAATVAFYELPLRQYREHVGPYFWPPTDSSINSYLAACKKRGCKPNTLFAYYRAIKTWLSWLHKRGVIEANPIETVEKPIASKKIPRAPQPDILQQFFETIRANQTGWRRARDLALFTLLLDTGLRVGELARLQVEDVHLAEREIRPDEGKTHSERKVVVSPDAAERLGEWLELRASLKLPARLRALFVSYAHDRKAGKSRWYAFSGDGIRQSKDRWLARAGLSGIRVHDLRHAYAIYTLRAGGDLTDIQMQLGHENIETTAIYLVAADEGRAKRHAKTSPLHLLRTASGEGEN